MVWNSWSGGETAGAGGRVAGTDWDSARKLATTWENISLISNAITLSGDGKYTVTFTSADTLDVISGTSEGDMVIVRGDVSGAGNSNLTIRHSGGTSGNIHTNAGVDIVLTTNTEWAMFIDMSSGLLTGGMIYGSA